MRNFLHSKGLSRLHDRASLKLDGESAQMDPSIGWSASMLFQTQASSPINGKD